MPAPQVAHVERKVREPHTIPWNLNRVLVRLELKNLQNAATGHANPSNPADRLRRIHPEERSHAIGGSFRHPHQRTTEHLPVELHGTVEIRHRNPHMTERVCSHGPLPFGVLTSGAFRLYDLPRAAPGQQS